VEVGTCWSEVHNKVQRLRRQERVRKTRRRRQR